MAASQKPNALGTAPCKECDAPTPHVPILSLCCVSVLSRCSVSILSLCSVSMFSLCSVRFLVCVMCSF